jgi:hypothetical protein
MTFPNVLKVIPVALVTAMDGKLAAPVLDNVPVTATPAELAVNIVLVPPVSLRTLSVPKKSK